MFEKSFNNPNSYSIVVTAVVEHVTKTLAIRHLS